MAATHRAQANGQIEQQNRTLEDLLRRLIGYVHGMLLIPRRSFHHQMDTGSVARNPTIDVQDE